MRSSRSQTPLLGAALALVLVLLVANWHVLERHPQRAELNRVLAMPDVPPSLALVTFAVGPLRGLIADVLWWRAVQRQDEGDFFEAIQLAEWIAKLQPTLAMVWAYNGWNMASNIVNEVREPAERWKWVHQGILLLRDEGLRFNPGNGIIRRELANIFLFRIGGSTDPFASYYQRQWTTIMMRLLPQGDAAELLELTMAPADEAALRTTAGVADVLARAEAAGLDLLAFRTWEQRPAWTAAQRAVVEAPETATAAEQVRRFVVRRQLRQEVKLDVDRMLLIDQAYGPLDWRLWQAQVIYWCANDGLAGYEQEQAGAEANRNTMIQQAMVASFREGRLIYLTDTLMMTANNLPIANQVDEFIHHVMENEQNALVGAQQLSKSFHESATVILYNYLYEDEAREMYKYYRDQFMTPAERAESSFESFIASRAELMLNEREKDMHSLVLSSYYQAYTWLALGEGHKAEGFERLAKLLWQRHQAKYADNPELALPPLAELRRTALDLATGDRSTLPPELQAILRRLKGEQAEVELKGQGPRPELPFNRH